LSLTGFDAIAVAGLWYCKRRAIPPAEACRQDHRSAGAMQSEKSSGSTLRPSRPRKRISSVSEQLTKSEIEALRQSKRLIDDYAQKHLRLGGETR
jgi:hypothetical protein